MIIMISLVLAAAALYLAAGFLFAFFFLIRGIEKVDAVARGSGWGFRLIILPGTILLWPVLLKKWKKAKNMRHDETLA